VNNDDHHQVCKKRLQQLVDDLLAEGFDHSSISSALTEVTTESLAEKHKAPVVPIHRYR
jgi:hypothetical protein